ncbi:hypothetical protein AB0J80_09440 [Actinoplanes sp. NPDC049548]|uniref:DUF7144 family membrane protein n=1 Tax=Actinoplanes sp. NPDC049548 TaxID=3155152 RepID=UPI003437290C
MRTDVTGLSPSEADQPYSGVEHSTATGWVAWVLLAGILLVLLGSVHFATGLIALARPEVLAGDRADMLLPVGLTTIAWLHLVIGALAVVAGVGLMRGLGWARLTATVLACLALLANFAFVGVYPVWSTVAAVLAVVVIYAIVGHGGEVAEAYAGS